MDPAPNRKEPSMTVQIRDRLRYADRTYLVLSAIGTGLFDPARFGLRVRMLSTDCWRGFHCSYALDADSRLLLAEVYIALNEEGPAQHHRTLFDRTPEKYMCHGLEFTKGGLVDCTWMSHDSRLTTSASRWHSTVKL